MDIGLNLTKHIVEPACTVSIQKKTINTPTQVTENLRDVFRGVSM